MGRHKIITLKSQLPNLIEDFTKWFNKHQKDVTVVYPCGDYDDMFGDVFGGCYDGGVYDFFGDEDDDNLDFVNSRNFSSLYDDDDYGPLDGDTLYDDYYYDNYWDKKRNKGKKNNKKNKKNKKNNGNGLSDEELMVIIKEPKNIYYYPDINSNQYRKFDDIESFLHFLDDNGISISETELSRIIRSDSRHCCIDPKKREEMHINELVGDHSYGALAYEVSGDSLY